MAVQQRSFRWFLNMGKYKRARYINTFMVTKRIKEAKRYEKFRRCSSEERLLQIPDMRLFDSMTGGLSVTPNNTIRTRFRASKPYFYRTICPITEKITVTDWTDYRSQKDGSAGVELSLSRLMGHEMPVTPICTNTKPQR